MRYGQTYHCGAGSQCLHGGEVVGGADGDEQFDRYNIYAGVWHEDCWDRFGMKDFVFDPAAAGESLEEDW